MSPAAIFPDEAFVVPAVLALADGTVFRGRSLGAEGVSTAEIVFNTAMTGYQEILTDPSYHGQIITLTYPHVGNTGVNTEDMESAGVQAAGLVMRDCPTHLSSFRASGSLPDYLKANGIVAITGVDTRKLTRILRDRGAQGACILTGDDAGKAVALARGFGGMVGQDLAQRVSTRQTVAWDQGSWQLGAGYGQRTATRHHVVAFDYGVKYNILRLLADRQCRITLVGADTSLDDILAQRPDGVFLSNGPGDPAACTYAIEACRGLLQQQIPLFGICLGQQVMALALGGRTLKLKAGHHGANHPVKDLKTGRVFITSQNHGFTVDADSLPANARPTHRSLFDGSLQGFELTDRPAFCFQGHPEASPGPHDIQHLFDHFVDLMADHAARRPS